MRRESHYSTRRLNVCRDLEEKHGRNFYHRGFPIREAYEKEESGSHPPEEIRPAANGGLWLGDPDIDALDQ